jgi:hypothetical protein
VSRKKQYLALGVLRPHLNCEINPGSPGIATSDISRSGTSNRAAANASSGRVKGLAEKPFLLSMTARVDASEVRRIRPRAGSAPHPLRWRVYWVTSQGPNQLRESFPAICTLSSRQKCTT